MKPRAIVFALLVVSALVGCSSDPSTDVVSDGGIDAVESGADTGIDSAIDNATPMDAGPPAPPPVELGRHEVAIVDTRRVVPGPGLPAETPALNSNNNLDVIRHDGRVFLAWRTGPDHFASDLAAMYVVSSTDETSWRFEARYQTMADLREPRFLSLNGSLFLYMARLGRDPQRFEPQGMSVTERRPDGTWTALEPFYRDGFIPWRARTERGTPYLVAYIGGEHIYQMDGIPLQVELLTTNDGRTFRGVNAAMPVVATGGGSETDFTLGDDGTLFAVTRNEAGDSTGWGSHICRAPAGDITRWQCHNDPRKYDSPLMFWHDGEAYLIARRNVTATGNYDLMRRGQNAAFQTFLYQTDYHQRPKRCSLWRYDQATDRIVFILDLPSRGDTCFPGIIQGDRPGDVVVYNYSSDIDGPDVSWQDGQHGATYLYRTLLRFAPRGAARDP